MIDIKNINNLNFTNNIGGFLSPSINDLAFDKNNFVHRLITTLNKNIIQILSLPIFMNG